MLIWRCFRTFRRSGVYVKRHEREIVIVNPLMSNFFGMQSCDYMRGVSPRSEMIVLLNGLISIRDRN